MSKEKQERFLQLYEPLHDRFSRFCQSRAYDDMDYKDLINDVLLIAYEKMSDLRDEQAFLGFLFGITRGVLSNFKQKRRTERMPEGGAHPTSEQRDPQTQTDLNFLYHCLDQLPEAQKDCILLFEISGFSIKEIAEIQNCSESAVKQRLKRGREALVAQMNYESQLKTL